MITDMKDRIYYKIDPKYQHYRGIRLFRHSADGIVQVVLASGNEPRRGRQSVALAINLLTPVTFFSNYIAYNYAIPCTEKEYNVAFKKVIKLLS